MSDDLAANPVTGGIGGIGMIEERDKLIKYIKMYTAQRRMEVPTTTLDYYKFMKLIGKGAFGKVTLGIHKLTGK